MIGVILFPYSSSVAGFKRSLFKKDDSPWERLREKTARKNNNYHKDGIRIQIRIGRSSKKEDR